MTSKRALLRRGVYLETATLGWNVVGVVVIAAAAVAARSIALAGFGLDSLIEILASLVVIWELSGAEAGREKAALRIIGWAFFALAIYIVVQSTIVLAAGARPHRSLLGIVWLAATLIAMLLLAWGKGRTGAALGNPVLSKESRVTLVDAALAAAVLAGLVLNAALGWWWADPLAGLVIVYYSIKEGGAALREVRD